MRNRNPERVPEEGGNREPIGETSDQGGIKPGGGELKPQRAAELTAEQGGLACNSPGQGNKQRDCAYMAAAGHFFPIASGRSVGSVGSVSF